MTAITIHRLWTRYKISFPQQNALVGLKEKLQLHLQLNLAVYKSGLRDTQGENLDTGDLVHKQ